MRVLTHLEQVVCDRAPHDVEARKVDQSCLEKLRHGEQTGLSICGREVHALFAQFTKSKMVQLNSLEEMQSCLVFFMLLLIVIDQQSSFHYSFEYVCVSPNSPESSNQVIN